MFGAQGMPLARNTVYKDAEGEMDVRIVLPVAVFNMLRHRCRLLPCAVWERMAWPICLFKSFVQSRRCQQRAYIIPNPTYKIPNSIRIYVCASITEICIKRKEKCATN